MYRYIVILSRFFTVSTLITMAFSLSTYCARILLFHIFLIWLKRAPERGWKKKIVKNMSGTFSFKLNVKKTYHDVNTFCRSNFCVPPVASRPAPPLHTQIWTLRVIT